MSNSGRGIQPVTQRSLFMVNEEFCRLCTTPNKLGYEYCFNCHQHRQSVPNELLPDRTAFLTYALKGDQSGFDVRNYKDGLNGRAPSVPSQQRLQSLTYFFVKYHSQCLKYSTGRSISGLVTVPSGQGRHPHPLDYAIAPYFEKSINRVTIRRTAQSRKSGSRETSVDHERYEIQSDVTGLHILVLEDTWVSGTQALGVAASLKAAGAHTVSVLCVARWLDRSWDATSSWLSKTKGLLAYDPFFCPVSRSYDCPSTW